MAVSSFYYFNSNAKPTSPANADLIREVPTYAMHYGSGPGTNWVSNGFTEKGHFDAMAERINPQVPVYLAMPAKIAENFTLKREFSKIVVYAFRPMGSTAYMVGSTIAMVLENTVVTDVTPIMQALGLPALKDAQRNYLTKMLGTGAYNCRAVKLWVEMASVVV